MRVPADMFSSDSAEVGSLSIATVQAQQSLSARLVDCKTREARTCLEITSFLSVQCLEA